MGLCEGTLAELWLCTILAKEARKMLMKLTTERDILIVISRLAVPSLLSIRKKGRFVSIEENVP